MYFAYQMGKRGAGPKFFGKPQMVAFYLRMLEKKLLL
jgi:hypothetical protein